MLAVHDHVYSQPPQPWITVAMGICWQRPDEPSGFEKVKECILMRTAQDLQRDPHHRVTAGLCPAQGRMAAITIPDYANGRRCLLHRAPA